MNKCGICGLEHERGEFAAATVCTDALLEKLANVSGAFNVWQKELRRAEAVEAAKTKGAEMIDEAKRAAFRAGAEAMRIQAANGIAVTMNGWGTSGACREFGIRLIDVVNALSLPEPKP